MPVASPPALEAFLTQELALLERKHWQRACRVLEPTTGPLVQYDGRTYLHFASNDYLSLARDARVIRAAAEALAHYGLGSGASRLMSGTSPLHEQLETRLAQFKQQEAALLFSSGYLTNLGLITSLVGPEDVVVCDHANHASLIDACRLSRARLRVYPHGDVARLQQLLERHATAHRRLIVSDGVFSMDGDVAPLRELVDVARAAEAWLLVDDAHGSFVLGAHGRGSLELCGVEEDVTVQMGTLSKALGGLGGFVVGARVLIQWLLHRARPFIYSTALPPAVVAGALAALTIVEEEPERRQRVLVLAARLREGLRAQGWDTLQSTTHIVPVLIGETATALDVAQALLAGGIYAPAVRPPTVPEGTARLRLSVTALHTDAHVDQCLTVLHDLRARMR